MCEAVWVAFCVRSCVFVRVLFSVLVCFVCDSLCDVVMFNCLVLFFVIACGALNMFVCFVSYFCVLMYGVRDLCVCVPFLRARVCAV